MSAPRRSHRASLVLTALGAVLATQLSCAAALAAGQGVALDAGRIQVETPLVAGKSYQLARLGVRNPGTQRTRYDLVVTPISTDARTPPAAWITFSPKQLTVGAGKEQAVTVSIRVPKDAPAGRYEALVGAQIAQSGGMSIGAGAAARLTFSVAGQPAVAPIVSILAPLWPVPVAAAVTGVLWLGRGRVRLRSPIARR